MRYLPKWSTLRYHKAEVLQVPQRVQAVLVKYLLLGIRILVYGTRARSVVPQKCLKDNRSSFSRVSLKSETTDAHP